MKVIGLAGWSGAGKTTLLTRLIPHFNAQGLRVSVIKHAHHQFDVDVPGKDSWRHREAGAAEVLVASCEPLGPDARIARRGRAAAAGTAEQAVRGRSRRGRRFQARAASQDRGASRRPTTSRCCSPTIPALSGLRPTSRLKPGCRPSISMISRPPRHCCCVRRCRSRKRWQEARRCADEAPWRNCRTIALPSADR